jgi:hypothetical protein
MEATVVEPDATELRPLDLLNVQVACMLLYCETDSSL